MKPIDCLRLLTLLTSSALLLATAASAQTGAFKDPRDGKAYRTVKIGKQTWMAENLNYQTDSSRCYNDSAAYCKKYGRLYTWDAAMKACPAGWHLPSDDEWTTFTDFVGGLRTAGARLKAASGWNRNERDNAGGNGTDRFGFSALPGGYGAPDGAFHGAGDFGYWWSSTEDDDGDAWLRDMRYDNEYVFWDLDDKAHLFSVRCLRDD